MDYIERSANFTKNIKALDDFKAKHEKRWNILGEALILELIGYIPPEDFAQALIRVQLDDEILRGKMEV